MELLGVVPLPPPRSASRPPLSWPAPAAPRPHAASPPPFRDPPSAPSRRPDPALSLRRYEPLAPPPLVPEVGYVELAGFTGH